MEQTYLSIIVNGRKPLGWSKNPDEFDPHEFKEEILSEVGVENFYKKVGKNPDIGITRDNTIVLKGRGEFKGRAHPTKIDADNYFSALVLAEGWKIVGHSVRPDHIQRARLAWPILVDAAQSGHRYTYKELCDLMNLHHRTAAWFLGEIQKYCSVHDLPALQGLVVNYTTRVPGAGYLMPRTTEAYKAELERVFRYKWSHEAPPDL